MIYEYMSKYIIYIIAIIAMVIFMKLGKNERNNTIIDKEESRINRREDWWDTKRLNINLSISVSMTILISFPYFFSSVVFGNIVGIGDVSKNLIEVAKEIPQIVISVHIALITFLSIFRKWDNEKYIAFSIEDVIKKFNIVKNVKMMTLLLSMIWIISIIGILCSKTDYYFAVESLVYLYFMIYFGYLLKLIMIFIDLLITDKIEQIMLDNLYKRFWEPNPKSEIDVENNECIKAQIEYLLYKYIAASKKIKFDNIKKIIYDSNLKCGKKTRFEKLKIISAVKCIIFVIIMSLWSNIEKLMGQKEEILGYVVFTIVFCLFVFVFACKSKGLATALTIIFYERSCYEITYSRKKRYVKEINIIRDDKYFKFVHSLKSIMAYVEMILENGKQNTFKEIFNICKAKRNITPAIDLLLVILDCMYFSKYMTLICSEININKKYKEFAKAFMVDIEGKFKNGKLVSNSYFKYQRKSVR